MMNTISNDFNHEFQDATFKIPIYKIEKKQIHLFVADQDHSIKLVNAKIYEKIPKETFLEKRGFFKKPIILHVIDTEGKEGYVKVNRTSFFEKVPLAIADFKERRNLTETVGKLMLQEQKSEVNSINPAKCYLIGELYVRKGSSDKAIPYFERAATNLNDYQYAAIYKLAKCYQAAGKTNEAITLFKSSLGKDHEFSTRAKYDLAGVYRSLGKDDEAKPYYIAILDSKKNSKADRRDAAARLLEFVLPSDPDHRRIVKEAIKLDVPGAKGQWKIHYSRSR